MWICGNKMEGVKLLNIKVDMEMQLKDQPKD